MDQSVTLWTLVYIHGTGLTLKKARDKRAEYGNLEFGNGFCEKCKVPTDIISRSSAPKENGYSGTLLRQL